MSTKSRSYSNSTNGRVDVSKSATMVDKALPSSDVANGGNSSGDRPLRRLSTPDVYRTIMLSQIFRSPVLSRFCLGILERLANSRSPVFDPDRNRVLNYVLRIFIYNHFCAGTETPEIKCAIKRIKSMGVAGVILNYAREIVAHDLAESDTTMDISAQQIQAWLDGNLKTLSCLDKGDYIGIK
ncbi:hypothetical protein SLS64_013680 [Diaporthe eres]|uniref:Proline dehydrogenase n=1 Tax=Diaporthe eres TaxID=83184 RepID=A0ABR1NPF0_DIAER